MVLLISVATLTGHALGVPTSTMTADGHDVKYCVTGYAPVRDVTVLESGSRTTFHLHTHISGSGCTHLPARTRCGQVMVASAVATGVGADGNPATSRASLREPSNPATCSPTGTASGHPSTAGGRVSLSGAGIALLAVIGLAAVGLLAIGVAALRRRGAR